MIRRPRDGAQVEHWVPLAVGAVLVAGFVLLLGLFGEDDDLIAIATTTTAPIERASTTTTVTTTIPSIATTTTTRAPVARTTVPGALLDGTPYTIHLERPAVVLPEGIHGVVMLDRADGTSVAAGILDVSRGRILEPNVGAGAVSLPGGEWTVTLRIYDALQSEVASAFPDTILLAFDEIRAPGLLPAFDLVPPLRWARDVEVPSVMQVDYGWFSVRRGCPEEALQCSDRRAVALMAGIGDGDGPDLDSVFLDSTAPRPIDDDLYLDPGPLPRRQRATVLWTGHEMIVFGGSDSETSGTSNLTDGAAYNPETDEWRLLASYPEELGTASDTRAVWGDGVMYVIDADGVAAYDPGADEWRILGPGVANPRQVVWSGDSLWVWTAESIFEARPGREFERLQPVPYGSWRPWEGLMLADRDDILVSALASTVCGGRFLLRPVDGGWDVEPTPSLATGEYADCSLAHQVGVIVGQVVIWEGDEHPAAVNTNGEWIELPGPPIRSFEGVGGSLVMGDLLLLPVGSDSAAYDPTAMNWIGPFELPTAGTDGLIWTGSELLGWQGACCFGGDPARGVDAWRWTPPPELFDK